MISIAIDGPAGAGKSTISRLLAEKLQFLYLDTGAMYRAVTWAALNQNLELNDELALTNLTLNNSLELRPTPQGTRVFWNQQEITEAIRSPKVSQKVSLVAKVPGVRQALLLRQRQAAAEQNVIMEGRDIGTEVLPQASCKFFLTASPLVRAERRAAELRQKGLAVDLEQLSQEIAARDRLDSERAVAPLKPALDAIQIDCSDLSLEEVLNLMEQKIAEVS